MGYLPKVQIFRPDGGFNLARVWAKGLPGRRGSEPVSQEGEPYEGSVTATRITSFAHTMTRRASTQRTRPRAALRQDAVGAQLATPLRDDEVSWLDAEFG